MIIEEDKASSQVPLNVEIARTKVQEEIKVTTGAAKQTQKGQKSKSTKNQPKNKGKPCKYISLKLL